MHEAQHALATELQRVMLPRGLLTATGMTIATRYQAATSGIEIGGDFYDVMDCADDRTALVIGDVQGHNLVAASLMGRLRTAVHAYTREGHGPAEVMTRANRWLCDLNTDPDRLLFATCCFLVVDPVTGTVTLSRAGHPPPDAAHARDRAAGARLRRRTAARHRPGAPSTRRSRCTSIPAR